MRVLLVCSICMALAGPAHAGSAALPPLRPAHAPGFGVRADAATLALPVASFAAAAAADSGAAAPDVARIHAWQTGLLRPDRLEHGSLSFTLALGAGAISRQPVGAAAGALLLGLAKETRDRRHTGFDPIDLLADVVGAGLAAWAAEALKR